MYIRLMIMLVIRIYQVGLMKPTPNIGLIKFLSKGKIEMYIKFPEKMQKLKKVFMPYVDKKASETKLVDTAPEDAVQAFKRFQEIGQNLLAY